MCRKLAFRKFAFRKPTFRKPQGVSLHFKMDDTTSGICSRFANTVVCERIVMLRATKHSGAGNEILR